MASNLEFSAVPSWPYLFASTASFMPIGFFIVAQTRYARAMCTEIGFPQPLPQTPKHKDRHSKDQELNSMFYLAANKEAVIGVALLALQAAGEWKAAGIALGCICVGGAGDMYLAMTRGSFGFLEAFLKIGLVKVIGVWAAWRICLENW